MTEGFLIFDMDGVLTDSEPLINAAAIGMFSEMGLEVQPEDFVPFVGAGDPLPADLEGLIELIRCGALAGD